MGHRRSSGARGVVVACAVLFSALLVLAAACGEFGSDESPASDAAPEAALSDGDRDRDGGDLVDASDASSVFDAPLPPYPVVVRADSPLSYWRLDEADASAAAQDEEGRNPESGFTAPIVRGAPGLVDGGKSIQLLAGSQVRLTDDFLVFSGTAPMSLEAWVRPLTIGGTLTSIVKRDDSNGYGYGLFLSNGRLAFRRETVTVDQAVADAAVVTPLQTYHVVVTYDGGVMRLWVDAVEVAVKGSSLAFPTLLGRIELADPINGFEGYVDEVAIYGKALTPQQIATHHAAGRQ